MMSVLHVKNYVLCYGYTLEAEIILFRASCFQMVIWSSFLPRNTFRCRTMHSKLRSNIMESARAFEDFKLVIVLRYFGRCTCTCEVSRVHRIFHYNARGEGVKWTSNELFICKRFQYFDCRPLQTTCQVPGGNCLQCESC